MASLGGHCPLLVLPRHSSLHLHFVPLYPHLGLPQYPSRPSLIATRRKHRHTFPGSRYRSRAQPPPSPLPLLLLPRLQAAGAPFPSPRSVPGSSSDSVPRSSSPVKDATKSSSASSGVSVSFPADSSPHPTKFVPYWKRTLPEPSSDRAASASSSQEAVNSTHSGLSSATQAEDNQHRDRTKSFTSGRPLPPSPLDGSIGKPPVIPPTVGVFGERSRTLPNPSSPVRASTRPPSPVKPALSGLSRPSTAGSSAPFSTHPPPQQRVPCRFLLLHRTMMGNHPKMAKRINRTAGHQVLSME
jgi:hypothetical protein